MSEERRDLEQEGARRVLSPVRLAVLLLLGALFLVLGGSRADAAEAGPVPDEGPDLVAGTLAAVDVGPVLAPVVDPVVAVSEPVVEPLVAPVEPVVEPLRPVVEQAVAPRPTLPLIEFVAPAPAPVAGPGRPAGPVHRAAAEGPADVTAGPVATAVDSPASASRPAPVAVADSGSEAPAHTPATRSTSATSDGGTGTPVPHAVLLTAFVAVLLLAGGVAPRRAVPPPAPTFLPPVFPA